MNEAKVSDAFVTWKAPDETERTAFDFLVRGYVAGMGAAAAKGLGRPAGSKNKRTPAEVPVQAEPLAHGRGYEPKPRHNSAAAAAESEVRETA